MTAKEWIKRRAEEYDDIQEVYLLYETCLKETKSNMSDATYRRAVRRAFFVEKPPTGDVRVMKEADGPNLNIVTTSSKIRTLEELLAYCKVDLDQWEVNKHIVNSWGSGANENFQIKAWMALRNPKDYGKPDIQKLIEDAKKYAPEYPKFNYGPKIDSGNMLEISLFDHHFGRLAWGKETGGPNYDIKIARKLAIEAVQHILSQSQHYNLDQISILIGNDFFNVNNAANTTFAGTSQSEDARWQKTFVLGRELWVEIIEMCVPIAPVKVVIIPGNHDLERIFYLGDALDCWFHKAKNVEIDNSPMLRKYLEWGKCFIGYTHGDKERNGSLINIMATEKPLEWSRTTYREWHKGHLHQAKAHAFQILDEERGVREWILPSLVAIDDWTAGKGYMSLRESIGNVWNKKKGKVHMIMYHPD